VSIAGEDTGFSLLKQDLAAIAIVFDFMNPVLPLWRLIDRGHKLWLDEPEPCRKHLALYCLPSLIEEAPTVDARASSALPKEDMVVAGKPSPQRNYHLVRINQSCTLTRWNRVWREWQCHPRPKGKPR
jgi:hypothetical protein